MASFSTRLTEFQKHKGSKFLWQLKLDNNDFEELRRIIQQHAVYKDFLPISKEIALYVSEWWRRDYLSGYPSFPQICESLNIDVSLKDKIEDACRKGSKSLGFQIIKTSGDHRERENTFLSTLYQGGLPMNHITADAKESGNWQRFFRALAWQGQDFSILGDPWKTLPQSESIKEFCSSLQNSVEIDKPESLPFHINYDWWKVIKKEIEQGVRERKARTPFEFKWLLQFDDIGKTIIPGFKVSGNRELSEIYIKEHRLTNRNFFTVSLLVNDYEYPLAEYANSNGHFFSRRNIEIDSYKQHISCNVGDHISIIINETGELLGQNALDFSDPKLVLEYEHKNNLFSICDQKTLQSCICRLICTQEWESVCDAPIKYLIANQEYNIFILQPRTDPFILKNTVSGKEKNINPMSSTIHTILNEECALALPIKEKVYNAPKYVSFYSANGESIGRKPINVLYAAKWSQQWSTKPCYGLIRAQVNLGNESVDSVQFLNVGDLDIKYISSSRDNCSLKIIWPHGTISSNEALQNGDLWEIEKDRLIDKRYVSFTFTPQFGNEFSIHIIPRFYDFCIFDPSGKRMPSNAIIPIIDINSYQFFLNIRGKMDLYPKFNPELHYIYTPDSKGDGNNVSRTYFNDPVLSSSVANSGSLSSLFLNGSSQIEEMMEESMCSLPDAQATIATRYDENETIEYHFKDFPYHLKVESGIIVVYNYSNYSRYNKELLAIPIDKPTETPIVLTEDPQNINQYPIPDSILHSTHTKWLVYGYLRGYVLPILFDSEQDYSKEKKEVEKLRNDERVNNLSCIDDVFTKATLFDKNWTTAIEWFNLLPQGQIPGSSILELVAIADNRSLRLKFAFQLYLVNCRNEDSLSELQSAMEDFQHQLSFLWAWTSDEDLLQLLRNIKEENIDNIRPAYYKWVNDNQIISDEQKTDYYVNVSSHIEECYQTIVNDFNEWFENLKQICLPKQTLQDPDVNNCTDNSSEKWVVFKLLSPEAKAIFLKVKETFGNSIPHSASANNKWILLRRIFSELLKSCNLSDILSFVKETYPNFAVDRSEEQIKREVRKNIIYGLKYKSDEI